MSAFEAPVFSEAAVKELHTGQKQLVAISVEEAAKYGAVAGSTAKDFLVSAWNALAKPTLLTFSLATPYYLLVYDPSDPVPNTTATGLKLGLAACGFMAWSGIAFYKSYVDSAKKRKAARAILETGYRPLAEGEVLTLGREAVSAIAMISKAAVPGGPK